MMLYVMLAVSLFLILIAGFAFFSLHLKSTAITRRIDELGSPDEDADGISSPTGAFANRFARVATAIRSKFGFRQNETIRDRFRTAGVRSPQAADVYFLMRYGLPVLAAAIVYGSLRNGFVAVAAAAVSWMLPEFLLDQLVKRYRSRIYRALPDVVDMLSICLEAGLGLDQAILRTAREMKLAYPDICYELAETNRERQAGVTRAEAWKNLVERTQSDDLDMMITMLQQADELGVPMSTALRGFSDSLRSNRCNHAKEKAKRTGVLIMVPLVLFIFPTLFVVLLGPAVFEVMKSLAK